MDGSDDFTSPETRRPAVFDRLYGVAIFAYYHSRISGIAKSGIVISRDDLARIPSDLLVELESINAAASGT